MRSRTIRMTTAALSAALLLAACADTSDEGDETAPDAAASDAADAEDGQDDPGAGDDPATGEGGDQDISQEDLEELLGDQQDLPDPNEQVEDGVFRGEGIVLPVPEGYQLDPTAYTQGLIAAITDDGSHQIAGQAVDTETLPDAPDLQGLIDANQAQFGEPTSDESIEVDGAAEARQLQYNLPTQAEGQPDLTLLLIVADNGDGRLAVFNYVAPSDEYDAEEAEETLSTVGFDPDSSPQPPATPAPAPEQPEEP